MWIESKAKKETGGPHRERGGQPPFHTDEKKNANLTKWRVSQARLVSRRHRKVADSTQKTGGEGGLKRGE